MAGTRLIKQLNQGERSRESPGTAAGLRDGFQCFSPPQCASRVLSLHVSADGVWSPRDGENGRGSVGGKRQGPFHLLPFITALRGASRPLTGARAASHVQPQEAATWTAVPQLQSTLGRPTRASANAFSTGLRRTERSRSKFLTHRHCAIINADDCLSSGVVCPTAIDNTLRMLFKVSDEGGPAKEQRNE